MNWLTENLADVIVGIVLVCALAAAVFSIVRKRKKGGCHGCEDCGQASSCGKRPEK
ncbi:MAG: FeoB-associated Cys-rich membrane protein [Oscillospiraceae bacterium]|jgi:hypothetical protein|nr:FeoB-associated Cys-rich membrane protein [Oscillospiraceae bacterium]